LSLTIGGEAYHWACTQCLIAQNAPMLSFDKNQTTKKSRTTINRMTIETPV
jgi:hypothetical protein